jgi:antitoxin (DNA-binding transcriptional repressor) of toxin-antitoxin stability system
VILSGARALSKADPARSRPRRQTRCGHAFCSAGGAPAECGHTPPTRSEIKLNVVTARVLAQSGAAGIHREHASMNSVGIREAKTHLSALARAAANGEPTLLTDYGKPFAIITSIVESKNDGRSDPSEFRKALLAVPHELDLDF